MVISTIARGASANLAHAVTVVLAIILMVVHAVWATVVLVRENREAIARFHRFSAAVRTIWPITHFCGLMGEPRWCGEFPRGNEPVRIGGSRPDHAIGPPHDPLKTTGFDRVVQCIARNPHAFGLGSGEDTLGL